MTRDTGRDARHFFRAKSKDVAELSNGGHYVLFDRARKIFPYLDLFPLEHVYFLVSFYGARPFMRAEIFLVHAHDSWDIVFPFSFCRCLGRPALQGVDEALASRHLVSLENANLSIICLELQQELMGKDCCLDLINEWEPHDSIVGEVEIYHCEPYGHGPAFTSFPYPYGENDRAQRNDLTPSKPNQWFV